jgi:signal transduction histidine kinase
MRSPLAAIQGLLQILSRRISQAESDPECENLIERCQVRIASAHDLVNDLLEYSKIQTLSQQEPPEALDLAQVVAEALEELAPIAEADEIRLTAELLECLILGREPQILTLAKNLIGNALRYTLPGGGIEVTVGTEDGDACLRVVDDGIGIDEIALAHVFDEFFRAPNAKEHEPAGTGLGLTMCKAIAESYGGVVSVVSTPHVGTELTVRLPLAADSPSEDSA